VQSFIKYVDDWGQADSYVKTDVGLHWKHQVLSVDFKIENIFSENIYLPEIAREQSSVPVIPEMSSSLVSLGDTPKF